MSFCLFHTNGNTGTVVLVVARAGMPKVLLNYIQDHVVDPSTGNFDITRACAILEVIQQHEHDNLFCMLDVYDLMNTLFYHFLDAYSPSRVQLGTRFAGNDAVMTQLVNNGFPLQRQ